MPSDILTEARELLNFGAPMAWSDQPSTDELVKRAPELLRALSDEVDHARRALKGMVELWDANNPDDPCGCVGASDDCKYPPPCELCVARLIMEGRTKELFE